MSQIKFEGPEDMLQMLWDNSLSTVTEETRAALGLHSQADVVRLAMHAIPGLVFENLDPHAVTDGVSDLLTDLNDERAPRTTAIPKVDILDAYAPDQETYFALARISTVDIEKGNIAASLCGIDTGDFALRATKLFTTMEQEMPGYAARISGTYAREDMATREFFSQTDIQPWGEEDYKDYGLPEDDE